MYACMHGVHVGPRAAAVHAAPGVHICMYVCMHAWCACGASRSRCSCCTRCAHMYVCMHACMVCMWGLAQPLFMLHQVCTYVCMYACMHGVHVGPRAAAVHAAPG